MIKIENTEVVGWEAAIRGMRNPKNSWEKSDSWFLSDDGDMYDICGNHAPFYGDDNGNGSHIGPNDHKLMMSLAKGGPVHAKYRRMIAVYLDVTAPLYWWKEFDTYKVGTVANSCSTMHKIHDKEFTLDDFSTDYFCEVDSDDIALLGYNSSYYRHRFSIDDVIYDLNFARRLYNAANEKLKRTDLTDAERKHVLAQRTRFWKQMIQLLPSSYNQKRTIMLNYEVLHNIYISRRHHKLDEWHDFCAWIESLPYSELITDKED